MKYLSTLLALFICFGTAFSQETGLINITLPHLDEDRPVSLYVPLDYDGTKAYDVMIMLHGLGDNSANMAAFAKSVAELDPMYNNYIYVIPDGGDDQNRDFYEPREDITIVDKCIDYVKANYNVAEDRIFLEGFSLGARSAMCYGLQYPEKFHALILNTPAVQGPKDAMNIYADLGIFERIRYENARKVPMIITNGADDIFYLEPIQMVVDSLEKYNAIMRHFVIPDMGHSIVYHAFPVAQVAFNGDNMGNDLVEIMDIDAPNNTLEEIPKFTIRFRSAGDNSITSCKFEVSNGANSYEYTWEGEAEQYVFESLEVEAGALEPGLNDISFKVLEVNGVAKEEEEETVHTIYYTAEPHKLPYVFNATPGNEIENDWFIEESPQLESWQTYQDGDNYAMAFYSNPTLMVFNYEGFKDELISPFFNIDGMAPYLSFDVAYNYFHYNIQGTEYIYSDTLVVEISIDGGNTFEEIYRKTREELATYDEPFKDIFEQTYIYNVKPAEENWRTEKIAIDFKYKSEHAQFKFSVYGAMGGMTIIDNIILDPGVSVEETNQEEITVFPNPTADFITINTELPSTYKVVDILGNDVTSAVKADGKQLDLRALSAGVYNLILNGKNVKVIVQ